MPVSFFHYGDRNPYKIAPVDDFVGSAKREEEMLAALNQNLLNWLQHSKVSQHADRVEVWAAPGTEHGGASGKCVAVYRIKDTTPDGPRRTFKLTYLQRPRRKTLKHYMLYVQETLL